MLATKPIRGWMGGLSPHLTKKKRKEKKMIKCDFAAIIKSNSNVTSAE